MKTSLDATAELDRTVTSEDDSSVGSSLDSRRSSSVTTSEDDADDGTGAAPRGRPTTVLVLGAGSKTGKEIVRHLASHHRRCRIHALCDDFSQARDIYRLCDSVLELSVRHAVDIEQALSETRADWVVLAGDSSESDSTKEPRSAAQYQHPHQTIHTVAARNVARVVSQSPYEHVRVAAVSLIGVAGRASAPAASPTFGPIGRFRNYRRRLVLQDYRGQEVALLPIQDRTTVVRTTFVTDGGDGRREAPSNQPGRPRRIRELRQNEKVPSLHTDRSDLASCIVDEICAPRIPSGHRVINITSGI
jgi:NAD(P)-dependent dehydrogenase (short-subunit alcohol dehydrogenase family)